jgi:hypothetical protein
VQTGDGRLVHEDSLSLDELVVLATRQELIRSGKVNNGAATIVWGDDPSDSANLVAADARRFLIGVLVTAGAR